MKSGFTLRQLVAEYRALRASVVRHWTAQGGGTRSADFHQLVRFDEAVDQALAEAIQWFFESLERARDLFAGILGHDLRNPLGTVRAAAQLQQLSDSSKQRDAAERALRSIDSMEQLIRDLLDFTRTRLGEPLPISREPMELEALAREVARAFGMAKPRREFRVDCAGETAGVWDAERIEQLLSNLIKNAIVHGDAHAPILITVRGNADSAEVSVHNQGAPIPPEMLPVIFDPLTRRDRTRTRWDSREERLGLGLYIVQQVASAHGGTVEVESTAESGTTFTIRLPRFASSARDEPFR